MPTASPEAPYNDERGGPAGRRGFSAGTLGLRLVLAAAVIALLCVCAWRQPGKAGLGDAASSPFPRAVPGIQAPLPPPPAAVARFDLRDSSLEPVRVTARIDPRTGLREDVLDRGDPAAIDAAALSVTLTRGRDAGAPAPLFILIARRAASGPAVERPALAVLRTGARGQVQTKFGAVETLEVTFGGGMQRTCTGFVTRDAAFRLDGWSCAPLGRPPEAQALACTLDALSFLDLTDLDTTAAFSTAAPTGPCAPTRTVAELSGRAGAILLRARNKK